MGTHGAGTAGGSAFEDAAATDERRALDLLYSATYEELRRMASRMQRGSPGLSLSPTTLVDEAWAKLARSRGMSWQSRLHFKRIVGRAMREVLVEAARRKYARKRGGRDVAFVTLDESVAGASTPADVLALDTALQELARLAPRQVTMVEHHFFGGLDVTETAALLEMSVSTVTRDLRAAKAWLRSKLRQAKS